MKNKKLCKVAYASISENGTVNGKKGDQTGKEVKCRECYDFGQTIIVRPKKTQIRKGHRIGVSAYLMAINNYFGYGQNDRGSSFEFGRSVKWKINGLRNCSTKVNVDCSILASECVNYAYNKEILPIGTFSGNIVDKCLKSGKFKTLKYDRGMKLYEGDILVRPFHHVVVVCEDGYSC